MAVQELVPLISSAPVDAAVRKNWLGRLFEAIQDDDPPYFEHLSDHWGDLCATTELASVWADQLLPTQRSVLCDRQSGTYAFFSGTTLCYSALFNAGQHMATQVSARVLGWGDRLGRIAPGYQADLVLLDLPRPEYGPLRDPLRQLVHGESGSAVDRVLIGGRLVVADGRVLTVDEAALRQRAQAAATRLDAMNEDGRHLAAALRPGISASCCGIGRHALPVTD